MKASSGAWPSKVPFTQSPTRTSSWPSRKTRRFDLLCSCPKRRRTITRDSVGTLLCPCLKKNKVSQPSETSLIRSLSIDSHLDRQKDQLFQTRQLSFRLVLYSFLSRRLYDRIPLCLDSHRKIHWIILIGSWKLANTTLVLLGRQVDQLFYRPCDPRRL